MLHNLLALMYLTQTPAIEVAVGSDTQNWWVPVLQAFLTMLGGALVWLLKSYGAKLISYIEEKTHSRFLGELAQRALVVALSLYQSEVKNLQRTSKWDYAAKAAMKKRGVNALKAMVCPDKLEKVAGRMGVESFLGHQVDAAVATAKQLGAPIKKVKSESPPDPTKT